MHGHGTVVVSNRAELGGKNSFFFFIYMIAVGLAVEVGNNRVNSCVHFEVGIGTIKYRISLKSLGCHWFCEKYVKY